MPALINMSTSFRCFVISVTEPLGAVGGQQYEASSILVPREPASTLKRFTTVFQVAQALGRPDRCTFLMLSDSTCTSPCDVNSAGFTGHGSGSLLAEGRFFGRANGCWMQLALVA